MKDRIHGNLFLGEDRGLLVESISQVLDESHQTLVSCHVVHAEVISVYPMKFYGPMKVEERQSSFLGMKKRGESDCKFSQIWAWLSFVGKVFEACIVHVLCGVVSNGAAYDLLKIAEHTSPSPIAAQRATGTSVLCRSCTQK